MFYKIVGTRRVSRNCFLERLIKNISFSKIQIPLILRNTKRNHVQEIYFFSIYCGRMLYETELKNKCVAKL